MLRDIVDVFREPSSFRGDPLNWAYSQIGHGYLGCAVVAFVVWILNAASSTYPNETIIALVVPLFYLIWWELDVQGWNGWDTIEDTAFVAAGASLFIVIDMSQVIDRLAAWFAITGGAIIFGVYRRT